MGVKDKVLQRWIEALGPKPASIERIVLFGSRARGTARPDSDYDLALVVSQRDRRLVDRCYDAVVDVLLETGRLVSLKIFTSSEFARLSAMKTPFTQRILAEGIEIG